MDFNRNKQNDNKTDIAWGNLHQRLENDGLLQGNDAKHAIRRTNYYRRLYVAAVFVACIISGLYLMHKNDVSQKDMLVLYNEANAPVLATMLEDGSVVYLSQQTSLKYPDHFEENKREVILQGDAFFDISKQAGRPFFIETEAAKIEVKGTSFSIKSNENSSFFLSVREGEVSVTKKSNMQVITVKAGEAVLFDAEQVQLIKSTTVFDDYFKHIHFKDEYLKNVASIINLHSDAIKLIVEPNVETRSLTLTLPEKINTPGIAEVICLALELQHTRQDNVIYISKKN